MPWGDDFMKPLPEAVHLKYANALRRAANNTVTGCDILHGASVSESNSAFAMEHLAQNVHMRAYERLPPTPAQRNCSFTLAGAGTISLQALPKGPFALTDSIGDKYAVTSPCGRISGPNAPTGFTESPAVEDIGTSDLDKIPLGFLAQLTTEKLPAWPATHAEQGGMTLVLGGGVANPGCVASKGRILQYNMVCCQTCAASAPPNSTMIIPGTIPNTTIASCTYVVEWHHPAACASKCD